MALQPSFLGEETLTGQTDVHLIALLWHRSTFFSAEYRLLRIHFLTRFYRFEVELDWVALFDDLVDFGLSFLPPFHLALDCQLLSVNLRLFLDGHLLLLLHLFESFILKRIIELPFEGQLSVWLRS